MVAPKILVVDDDRESGDLLREVLEENGYQVRVLQDGGIALNELCRESAFRIVIADLRMPGMTGMELLRELRQQDSHYGIVLMSSFISDTERKVALQLGVDGLLDKPFRLSELLQMVSELAGKNSIEVSN